MSIAPATSVRSFTRPLCRYAIHCWRELQAEPMATTTPIARSDFLSAVVLIRRFRTQDERVMAQVKWRSRVKGVMWNWSMRLKKTPMPEVIRAADEQTSVRLNHRGVVSNRRCTWKVNPLILLFLNLDWRCVV